MRALALAFLSFWAMAIQAAVLSPVVEIEEDVYTYSPAHNGAGPMWCHGSTCLARVGERLFATGLETVADAKPLNNCRWMLYERHTNGWQRVWLDAGRTREPSPIAAFPDGRLFVSANPTLGTVEEPNGGPARPEVVQFDLSAPSLQHEVLRPVWRDHPPFTEHSYRSFAADAARQELILFQNIGYTHAEWTFYDRKGRWSSQGQLSWPWAAEYDRPQPVRVCYPNVAVRDRAVHFCGVSDVQEPYGVWREYKRKLTGQEWDYDFRRLFYTWTSDVTRLPFAPWVEVASRDTTAGWITPGDLYVSPRGNVHLVWTERALDERLRPKFFPQARQTNSLNYAVLRNGKVVRRITVEMSTEDKPGIIGSAARFQTAPGGRLFLMYYAGGKDPDGNSVSENRVREVFRDSLGLAARVPLQRPFVNYFTATLRSGSPASRTIDILGEQQGRSGTISFARVRLF